MTEEPTVPLDLAYLLTTDHVGHLSWARRDGSIVGTLMWIDWQGERVLTSSPVGSAKGRAWRRDPHVHVSVVDRDDDWRFVQVSGRVTDIRPDAGLEFIDRMSRRYMGSGYRRRDIDREVFEITPVDVRFGHGGFARRR